MKHLINTGHARVFNSRLLRVIDNDSPNTPFTNSKGELQSGKIGNGLSRGHISENTTGGTYAFTGIERFYKKYPDYEGVRND